MAGILGDLALCCGTCR